MHDQNCGIENAIPAVLKLHFLYETHILFTSCLSSVLSGLWTSFQVLYCGVATSQDGGGQR